MYNAYVTRYKEIKKIYAASVHIRNFARKNIIRTLNFLKTNQRKNCIKILYYHHIFDDEIKDFERQISFLKNNGDFISLDDIYKTLSEKASITGNYFAITFDDGFKNCFTNGLETLLKYNINAAFFLPVKMIGKTLNDKADLKEFYSTTKNVYPLPIEFLNWDDCRKLAENNMTIGSHTLNHLHLITVDEAAVTYSLAESKKMIESKIGINCNYFACPQGHRNIDFTERDIKVAHNAGYKLFLTTDRGENNSQNNSFVLYRDHVIAEWENFQLNYFLL